MFKQTLKFLPNLLTLANLMCGIVGIHMVGDISVLDFNYFIAVQLMKFAAMMIFLGAIFDFMDGLAAKLLNAHSEEGKILDSLADLITFGLLPAYMLHKILILSTCSGLDKYSMPLWLYGAPLIMPCFTAYRLARFCVKSNSTHFQGMSSTAAGLTIASLVLCISNDTNFEIIKFVFVNNYIIVALTLILSILMVSSVRFISFKFTSKKLNENLWRYSVGFFSVLSIIFFKFNGLALSCILYIVLSIAHHYFSKN